MICQRRKGPFCASKSGGGTVATVFLKLFFFEMFTKWFMDRPGLWACSSACYLYFQKGNCHSKLSQFFIFEPKKECPCSHCSPSSCCTSLHLNTILLFPMWHKANTTWLEVWYEIYTSMFVFDIEIQALASLLMFSIKATSVNLVSYSKACSCPFILSYILRVSTLKNRLLEHIFQSEIVDVKSGRVQTDTTKGIVA